MKRFCIGVFLLLLAGGVFFRVRSSATPAGDYRPGAGPVLMTDVTANSGVRFLHRHGGSGRHYYPETMGGGGAFFDYDGDGWLDLFLVQGGALPGYAGPRPLRSALYRNDGAGAFTDVTTGSGLDVEMYGMGVAAGDYDNDGRPDLYITALGGNRLFHNEGSGRFLDVTRSARVAGSDMSTSAAWLDYDRDGLLDLFVCRYTDYSLATDPRCPGSRGRPAYCSPNVYSGTRSTLYRNSGHGLFSDVTLTSGIGQASGRAMGVVSADFNRDGWTDLYVANDWSPNLLFMNDGRGRFTEQGLLAGVSYGENGKVFAGMGVDCGDYDNDGHIDLMVTNFEDEPTSIYRGSASGTFSNETFRCGVGSVSLPYLKWGCRFVDLDLDGLQDVFVANGHVDDYADERGRRFGYSQPCQVLRNDGGGTFSDVSSQSGSFFSRRQVARGAAFGDYDNDGDTDVLIACSNQPAILLRNDSAQRNNWIRLSLSGSGRGTAGPTGCNREALGARITVRSGQTLQTQFVRSGTSYLSSHDRRLTFGIGPADRAGVQVRWPCGGMQSLEVSAGALAAIDERKCRNRPASMAAAARERP